ncbi:MAG: hypothetical protein AB7G37_01215 [Solirubrobacteraceae bacterium]
MSDRRGLTLDAGALLAYGRGDDRTRAFLRIAATRGHAVVTSDPKDLVRLAAVLGGFPIHVV